MDKKIEAAIRETLVIGNPVSIKRCVDKLKLIFEQEQALRQANVKYQLPPVEQHLLDEAVGDVITISTLNEYSIAKKLISEQFYVAAKEDLSGGNCT